REPEGEGELLGGGRAPDGQRGHETTHAHTPSALHVWYSHLMSGTHRVSRTPPPSAPPPRMPSRDPARCSFAPSPDTSFLGGQCRSSTGVLLLALVPVALGATEEV